MKPSGAVVGLLITGVALGGCGDATTRDGGSEDEGAVASRPDRITFVTTRTGDYEIGTFDVSTGEWTNHTDAPASLDFGFDWSDDGTVLYFGSDREGNREIHRVEIEGGPVENLTRNDAGDAAPSVVPPGGTHLLFVSDRDHSSREIYRMRIDGSEVERLTVNERYEEVPRASPDGTKIAFGALGADPDGAETLQIFVMDADGSNERQLTSLPGHNSAPRWSPDGRRIAFYGKVGEGFGGADIFVMNADGTGLTNLTNDEEPDWQPAWSPDGRRIAWARGPGDPLDVWIMNADGSDRRLLVGGEGRDEQPAWRPGG